MKQRKLAKRLISTAVMGSALIIGATTAVAADHDRRGDGAPPRLDTNNDGLVTLEEFRFPGERMLEHADVDGDGAVTLDEMRTRQAEHRAEMMQRAQERMAERDAELESRFNELDTDGSGAVTPEEGRAAVFARLDSDGDGYLTREELRESRKSMGGKHGRGMHDQRGHGNRRPGFPGQQRPE